MSNKLYDAAMAIQKNQSNGSNASNNGYDTTNNQLYNDSLQYGTKSTVFGINPSYKADNPLTTQYNNTVGKVSKVQSWLNSLNTKINGNAEDKTESNVGRIANEGYAREKQNLQDKYLESAYDVTDGISSANALNKQKEKTVNYGKASNEQKAIDKGNYYSSILNNKDLVQKGVEGSNKYNANADIGRYEDPGNKIKWAEEHQDLIKQWGNDTAQYRRVEEYQNLTYATTEEKAVYNYILATEGSEAADDFLDYIRPSLNSRAGQEVAEGISKDSGISRYMRESALALDSGVQSGFKNIEQNFKEEARPYTANEMANMYVGEDVANRHKDNPTFNLEKLSLDAVNTIGSMTPMLMAGAFSGGAGSVVGGLSARGATYQQLLNDGYTEEQADSVATVVGLAEGVTQYLLGGISAAGGKLTGWEAKEIANKMTKPLAKAVTTLGIDTLGEINEELLQNKIQAIAENVYLNADNNLLPNEDDLYTIAVTALSTLALQTPVAISNAYNDKSTIDIGKSVNLNNMTQSLIDVGLKSTDPNIKNMAENLNSGKWAKTDELVGQLAESVEASGFDLGNLETPQATQARVTQEQATAQAEVESARKKGKLDNALTRQHSTMSFAEELQGTKSGQTVELSSGHTVKFNNTKSGNTKVYITTPDGRSITLTVEDGASMTDAELFSYIGEQIDMDLQSIEAVRSTSNPLAENGTKTALGEQTENTQQITQPTTENATQVVEPRVSANPLTTNATTSAKGNPLTQNSTVVKGQTVEKGTPISVASLKLGKVVGMKVIAGDRGNIGTIMRDNGDGTYLVGFRSKEGATANKVFAGYEIRLASNKTIPNKVVSKNADGTTTTKVDGKVVDNETLKPEQTVADLETAKQIHRQMPTLEPETKVTGNSENVATNNLMPDDFREEIKSNPDLYTVDHNKDTLAKAIEIRDTKGLQGAIDTIQEWIANGKNGMKLPLEAAPLSKIIVAELYKAENRNSVTEGIARQITTDIGAELAYAGKFGQANAILRNTDPLTRQQTFQKYIDMINRVIQDKYGSRYKYRAELTEAEIAKIENLDMSSESAMEDMLSEIFTRVGREMPSTLWQKLRALSKTGMLTLPATHVGNFAANVPTAGMRILNNFFSGAMQKLGSARTKLVDAEIPVQNENGTWTANVNGKELTFATKEECTAYAKAEKFGQTRASFYGSEHRGIAKQVYDEVKNDLGGNSNKWETGKKVLETQTIIKPVKALAEWGQNNADTLNKMITDKFGKDAEQIFDASATQSFMNFISWAMEQEDKPFVRWAFIDSLASYCKARGINSVEQVTNEAIAHATVDAMYYTYKNTNAISQVIQQFKKGGSRGDTVDALGDALSAITEVKMPFVNTLANIGIMAVEHNPIVATVKAVYETFNGADGTQIADTLAKGFTGGLIIALGSLLRATGLMTGDEDEDYDKAQWLKASGQMPNSILGKWDVSQLQPISTLLSFGANLWDNFTENEGEQTFLQLALNAMWQSADGVFDMEMLQNMSELFGSNDNYSDESKAQAFFYSLLTDLPSRFTPNIWRGSINAFDDTNRYYKYGDGIGEKILNALKYVSGFGREDLAENVNVKGTSDKGDRATTIFDSILYPGQIGQGKQTEVDGYLADLEKEFGDKTMYPTKFKPDTYQNSNGDKVTVGYEEIGQFQKTYSKNYLDALDKTMKSTDFKNLDTAAKKSVISSLKSFALDVAKAEAFKNEGISYASDYQDIINGDDEKGIPALGIDKAMDYFMFKKSFDSSVTTGNHKAIDNAVGKFENLNSDVKKALFAKDTDIKALVNAADYDINAKDYYSYKNALNNAADQRNLSKTGSVAKMYAIAEAGLDDATITNIISNNAFGLSATSLAVIEVLTQEPYSLPLEDAAKFLYETDYTVNGRYRENDIIDKGMDSVNEETRKFAKALDLGHEEVNEENLQKLYDELLMEDANMTGVIGGKANGTLSNLEVANSLSTSDSPILSNNATAIYNALRDKLSNYYNGWGGYSYQSEVNYLPKSYAKGYVYGRKAVDTTNNLTKSANRGR